MGHEGDTDILGMLLCARRLYEREKKSILIVFEEAASALGVDENIRFEAIRLFVVHMPDPERVFRIQEMLVGDLIEAFNRAITALEVRLQDSDLLSEG